MEVDPLGDRRAQNQLSSGEEYHPQDAVILPVTLGGVKLRPVYLVESPGILLLFGLLFQLLQRNAEGFFVREVFLFMYPGLAAA